MNAQCQTATLDCQLKVTFLSQKYLILLFKVFLELSYHHSPFFSGESSSSIPFSTLHCGTIVYISEKIYHIMCSVWFEYTSFSHFLCKICTPLMKVIYTSRPAPCCSWLTSISFSSNHEVNICELRLVVQDD